MFFDFFWARLCKLLLVSVFGIGLSVLAVPIKAQSDCSGCLCPGDPCNLCPLPPMIDAPQKPNEPETCIRIREQVPPTSALPGSNEYFPSLDRSVAVCVAEGGDVIRNRRRSEEFPARVYCKPPVAVVSQ